MRNGGAFTLVVSGGVASIDGSVLFQVWVVGPSAGDAVTELMRMPAAAAPFQGTSINCDRQSVTLL